MRCSQTADAEAALEHALLDRHEQFVLGTELRQQRAVERLGEARVGDRGVDPLLSQQVGGVERLLHAAAVAEQRDALPSRRISPVPTSIARGSSGSATPTPSPRG